MSIWLLLVSQTIVWETIYKNHIKMWKIQISSIHIRICFQYILDSYCQICMKYVTYFTYLKRIFIGIKHVSNTWIIRIATYLQYSNISKFMYLIHIYNAKCCTSMVIRRSMARHRVPHSLKAFPLWEKAEGCA